MKWLKEWYMEDGIIQFMLGNIFFDEDQLVVTLGGGKVYFAVAWICLLIAIVSGINAFFVVGEFISQHQ